MGRLLDEAQQVAYTDSTSGLPNFRAAMHKLEQVLANAKLSDESFSILLIDGDNLRFYNNISYAAGDEVIRKMSELLMSRLRPGDFIARWRSGDEFIAILPGTPKVGAQVVGNRFRLSIKEASEAWEFPYSISIGIAVYPNHGTNLNALIDRAEAAMKQAKDQGKDQVVVAD
jgi:diguanylate cyclase (GGDEF)-like protein